MACLAGSAFPEVADFYVIQRLYQWVSRQAAEWGFNLSLLISVNIFRNTLELLLLHEFQFYCLLRGEVCCSLLSVDLFLAYSNLASLRKLVVSSMHTA